MAKEPTTVKPKPAKRSTNAAVSAEQCDALVQLLSIPVALLSPGDALTPEESAALSIALLDAAQANQYISNIIINLSSVGGVGTLGMVGGAILGRRVASHLVAREPEGSIKSARLQMLGLACAGVTTNVAARRTRSVDRQYRKRKNNPSASGIENETVPDSVADESGPDGLAGVGIYSDSPSN